MLSISIWALRGNGPNAMNETSVIDGVMNTGFKDMLSIRGIPGLTSIPVCYNPYGNAISSIGTEKSRNFPCDCTNYAHSGMPTSENLDWQEEQLQFQEAAGLSHGITNSPPSAEDTWGAARRRRSATSNSSQDVGSMTITRLCK